MFNRVVANEGPNPACAIAPAYSFVDMTKLELNPLEAPLWKLPTVMAFTTIGRTAWLQGVKRGLMPQPLKIPGTRSVAWRANEVRDWVEGLK